MSYGPFTLHGTGNGNQIGNETGNELFCSHCSRGNGTRSRRNLRPGTRLSGEMSLEPIRPSPVPVQREQAIRPLGIGLADMFNFFSDELHTSCPQFMYKVSHLELNSQPIPGGLL